MDDRYKVLLPPTPALLECILASASLQVAKANQKGCLINFPTSLGRCLHRPFLFAELFHQLPLSAEAKREFVQCSMFAPF